MLDVERERKRGIVLLVAALSIWGILPIYFHLLSRISTLDIVCSRILLAAILLVICMKLLGHSLAQAIPKRELVFVSLFRATCLGLNWYSFTYGVMNHQTTEASLGYFIAPLFLALFGALFFKEEFRTNHRIALFFACIGVVLLAVSKNAFPTIGIAVAASWSVYLLIGKRLAIDPLFALLFDFGIVCVPCMLYFISTGASFLSTSPLSLLFLLFLMGPLTVIPMFLYISGVKRLPLSLVGFLSYYSPTLQFLSAVLVLHEPISRMQLGSYIVIWCGVALFLYETFVRRAVSASEVHTSTGTA